MAKPETKQSRVVELSDVVLDKVGPDRWRVSVVTLRGQPTSEKTLERSLSLPAARLAALTWKARNQSRLP